MPQKEDPTNFRPIFRVSTMNEESGEFLVDAELMPVYPDIFLKTEDEELEKRLKEIYKSKRKHLLRMSGIAIRDIAVEAWLNQDNEKKAEKRRGLKLYLKEEIVEYSEEYFMLEIHLTFKSSIVPLFEEDFSYEGIIYSEDLSPPEEEKKEFGRPKDKPETKPSKTKKNTLKNPQTVSPQTMSPPAMNPRDTPMSRPKPGPTEVPRSTLNRGRR